MCIRIYFQMEIHATDKTDSVTPEDLGCKEPSQSGKNLNTHIPNDRLLYVDIIFYFQLPLLFYLFIVLISCNFSFKAVHTIFYLCYGERPILANVLIRQLRRRN